MFEVRPRVANWMTPILDFLVNDVLPEDNTEARRVRRQVASFTVVNGELFRRGFSSPLLKCLDHAQADYVLTELYRGICSMHSSVRSMAVRVLRAGYYWPMIKQDARMYTNKCREYQQYRPVFNTTPEEIHMIGTPWPFSR